MTSKVSVGFIGAGKMATALGKGFVRGGIVDPGKLLASDVNAAARAAFAKETGGRTTDQNHEVAAACDTVILAIKPGQVSSVLAELRERLTGKHLVLSIVAGVPLARLEAALPEARLIRVMPNTPALVSSSATAYALGQSATPEDAARADSLLSSVGLAYQISEGLLDAVTGLSGSGPAYVFLFIEALADGGVAAGLPRELALKLATQTVLGSARLALETGLHPGALKDMVTSPGGTTIEGVHELELGGFRGTVISAVRAATDKSKRLGQ
jgi:pyrroline-5-carboxylate reductase